jgi:hypothetical protein
MLYLKIKSAPWALHHQLGKYTNSDLIKCTFNPIPAAGGASRIPAFGISGSANICVNETRPAGNFRLNEISTSDYLDKIGFEIT